MNPDSSTSLIEADLILLHAPSVYDFRNRDDTLFAYLSSSDSVNVSPIYEMYPLGFKALESYLSRHGFKVTIINIAALMLCYPDLEVPQLLACLRARLFGIDLHWMCHVQGSLALAEEVKACHPETPIIFGGFSASYYWQEVLRFPQVDMVMRGYDTLEPMLRLLRALEAGDDLDSVPNLCWKDRLAGLCSNAFTHLPDALEHSPDWSSYGQQASNGASTDSLLKNSPYILTLHSTGCSLDCPWCGGSREAMRRLTGKQGRTVIHKAQQAMVDEIASLGDVSGSGMYIYTLQWYNEPRHRIEPFLQAVKKAGIDKIHFELYHLYPLDLVRKMCQYVQPHLLLAPESHDREISRLAGRGQYSMQEMEQWIEQVLQIGVPQVQVWFFIGMPQQTSQSVYDTVAYCEELMARFPGGKVIPLICPMVPFLDPASTLFEQPEEFGYRVFHRTLEEHRRAMTTLTWEERLNYETEWMSRREIVFTSYEAVRRLVKAKAVYGVLPKFVTNKVVSRIDETVALLRRINRANALPHRSARLQALARLKPEILAYNQKIFQGSSDQLFPVDRPFEQRWFDDVDTVEKLKAVIQRPKIRLAG